MKSLEDHTCRQKYLKSGLTGPFKGQCQSLSKISNAKTLLIENQSNALRPTRVVVKKRGRLCEKFLNSNTEKRKKNINEKMNIRDKAWASNTCTQAQVFYQLGFESTFMMSIIGCPRQVPAGYTRRGTFIFHFAFCRRDFVFSLNYYGFLIYFTRSINIQIIPVSNNEKN